MKHFNRAALLTVSLSLLPLSLTAAGEAMKVDADSFRCIREMTPVRHFYVDNLLGNAMHHMGADGIFVLRAAPSDRKSTRLNSSHT